METLHWWPALLMTGSRIFCNNSLLHGSFGGHFFMAHACDAGCTRFQIQVALAYLKRVLAEEVILPGAIWRHPFCNRLLMPVGFE